MRAMLARDNRAPDAILMGHLINSVSFFASATMLLLAASSAFSPASARPTSR
jgi:uncharacterized membrane protein